MRKSILYLFVALTLVSLGLTLVPSAFSQTENIKIVSYSYYVDSLGILDVVGEVQNIGSNTVASVILSGTASSSDGTVDSYTQAWVVNLAPQQKAPFYMEFYSPSSSSSSTSWSGVSVSEVDLTVSRANATANYQYPDLKITSSSASIGTSTDDKGVYWVTGTVQNTGSQTAQNITVVGTFYNATGTVVAVGYSDTLTPNDLASSGTASFKLGAFDLNQTIVSSNKKISSYSLLIQVVAPILQGTAPVVTSNSGSSSSSSSSSTDSSSSSSSATQSSGSSSNTISAGSSNTALICAIIIVVSILIIVGTMLVLRKWKLGETRKVTKKESIKAKKAGAKSMVETLPLTFFSEPRRTCNGQNVSLFKYFLRTQVCL